MEKRISVPSRFLPALALIAENADKLQLIQDVAESLGPDRQGPSAIAAAFAVKAALPLADASQIVTQAMSLQDLRITNSLKPSEVFDAITASLQNDAKEDWKAKHLAQWKSARSSIEKLVDPGHPLCTVYKALKLSYEHTNVLYDATILTDLRPVFDDTGREVKRMTISHVIELRYSYGGREPRKFFAALDANDVTSLKNACIRAEIKAATLKETMKTLPWPVVISGEHDA
jgi:hypothetical protein